MSDTMHASLRLTALNRVMATRGNLRRAIHHTDRGSQYASRVDSSAVTEAGMRQSMSRKGDCLDNAVAESFFGTLEQELVSEASWREMSEARRDISAYIHHHYNCERLHPTLGYATPQAFEAKHNRPAPEAVAA
jgi:putative transposase